MARPFKKQTVRYYTADGRRKPVPLCPDLGRSKQLLNKLLTDAAMRQHGLADPYADHRKRPLADHLADFRAALAAKGNHPRHVRLTIAHLEAAFEGIGAAWLADLDAAKVSDWLAGLR